MSPASIVKLGLVLSAVTIAIAPALAEKCHKCDFSDEPIIVVGKPAKQQSPTPSVPAAKAAAVPCLPGNPACHPVPPAAISVPLPPPSHPIGGATALRAKPGTGVQKVQLHCSTASTCNDLIAHCAGQGGQWVAGDHNGKGQPTSGDCFID